MTKETYNKAAQLNRDINEIEYHLRRTKEYKDWITISTPYRKGDCLSSNFQKELVGWLEQKLKEYQKEFDEI